MFHEKLVECLIRAGFIVSKHDSCLVYKECEMGFFIAVIHVDDFAFGYSTEVVMEFFLAALRAEFGVKVETPLLHYI